MHYWLSGSLQALGQTDLEADVHAQEAVLSAFQHVDRNQVSACFDGAFNCILDMCFGSTLSPLSFFCLL
jgi:hypothetical protein